ncbi:hypothetical protein [Aeromicrobium wangtongii]|uniref:DUF4352 domain-containing protein n=1 Tax=Aeromicrobium wangtongii TaxID=2969247 RepID=A0ABY5M667_9ACTN|nr:hypothetical protein [Aeromicrobium wangtongii]MCD9198523.1 hypothetical protein [Aeromicrobium wangtongii]UUP12549.1 hypothetical protein NQV15_11865 [Aeromicrobium wangtongii]
MRTSLIAAIVASAALTLAGCSSSEPEPTPATPTAAVPKGFDVPAGVTITKGGTKLALGAPATVVYEPGDRGTSAVTVTVAEVKQGSMKDFRFFSLDEQTKKSTPYYVKATVKNDGPAGLGGAALPLYALDSSNTNLPANEIVGTFKPCPSPTLPASFLPGATADVCLVYLVPEGRIVTSVSLQTGTTQDAIAWTP